jgi:hypothetical protein
VSEVQWRIGQYVECAFSWLPVMLIWIGVGLRVGPAAGAEPAHLPSTTNALLGLAIASGAVAGTGALAVVRCSDTGVSWTIGLGVWLALWVSTFVLVWSDSRSTRPQPSAEPVAAPDPAAGFATIARFFES